VSTDPGGTTERPDSADLPDGAERRDGAEQLDGAERRDSAEPAHGAERRDGSRPTEGMRRWGGGMTWRADPEDRPGDPVCWLPRVCQVCGALADEDPPTTCRRCGTEMPGA
jgi:hypothetical protein